MSSPRATLWVMILLPLAVLLSGARAGPGSGACNGEAEPRERAGNPVAVRVLDLDGSRIRLAGARWVSGTEVVFDGGLRVRIAEVRREDAWALVLEGSAEPGECPLVQAVEVRIAPLRLGGSMSSGLSDALGRLVDVLPVELADGGSGLRPDLFVHEDEGRIEIISRGGNLRHSIPSGPDAHPTVLSILVEAVALRQLAVLDNPFSPYTVSLGLEGEAVGGPDGASMARLAVGTDVRVRVTPEQSGYLTLLNLGPDGSTDLLAPTGQARFRVEEGVEVRVPDPESGLVYRAGFPLGMGLIRALVTSEPLPTVSGQGGVGPSDALEFFRRLEDRLGVALDHAVIRIEPGASRPWASALAYYEVFDPY